MFRGKVTFPVRGKVIIPFASFQVPVHVPFFTLYTPPFPSPFLLRPLTPSRFPIWESSWAHRDSRRGSRHGSRFRSSPCFHLSSRLWFPLSETTFQGLESLVLRHFEAVQGILWVAEMEVAKAIPTMRSVLLLNRVPAMFPKLLPHGFLKVPGLCFWE